MDTSLKQRLIGAAVLVALAVIFLPMLVQGPAPDSGAADVPLSMPATPDTGMETRELPLAGPADASSDGATGMPVNDDAASAAATSPARDASAAAVPARFAASASTPCPRGPASSSPASHQRSTREAS